MSVTTESGSRVDWLLFILLGFFWGSSYLFIKIGVDAGLEPFTLVALRLLVGFALLAVVVFGAREPVPRDARTYAHLVVIGFFGVAFPFLLITFAEQSVDSALAATLTSPVPLFVIPIAAILLGDAITINKVVGVTVGMIGVAILVGFDLATIGQTDLTPQLILLTAALSYALGSVYARRFVHGLRPMIPSLFQVFFAMLMAAAGAFALEDPIGRTLAVTFEGLFAVVWLGLLGSGMAYLLFYRLLGRWGPTRVHLVAYTLPVWGIALGWLVLNEQINSGLVLGTALVVAGIVIVNVQRQALMTRAGALGARLRSGPTDTPTPDAAAGPR